jgi:hypothetical protein
MLSVKEFVQRINNDSNIDLEILEMYPPSSLSPNGMQRYFWKTSSLESIAFDCPLATLLDYLESVDTASVHDFYSF